MSFALSVECAVPNDAEALRDIYAPYVTDTAITFEYDVPTVSEFRRRIENTLKKYPYIIARLDGDIVGYAYAGAFKGRAAYDRAVETSIYIKTGLGKSGIGKALYTELERLLKLQNILNLNACIAYPETEDEYLTKNSADFHRHMGYSMVGEFHKCGYKFGRWYNMVWMEKHIGAHSSAPKPVIPFSELNIKRM